METEAVTETYEEDTKFANEYLVDIVSRYRAEHRDELVRFLMKIRKKCELLVECVDLGEEEFEDAFQVELLGEHWEVIKKQLVNPEEAK